MWQWVVKAGCLVGDSLGKWIIGLGQFKASCKCQLLLENIQEVRRSEYPLPAGITNYGIALKVYGSVPESGGRNENIELPDYEDAAKLMATRKNMTLMFLWNRYKKKCEEEGARFYQYSQYCELYNKWCEENYETATLMLLSHKRWKLTLLDRRSPWQILLPVRLWPSSFLQLFCLILVLEYSQYIYAEEMKRRH